MDKKSLSRRANRIQNEKIELENELLEEDDEVIEEFEEEDIVEQEQIDDKDDSVEDSMDDFRAMPKVQIDAEVPTSGGKNLHKTNNHHLFKWILVCIICIVLGIVGYGGYKVFFSSNTHDKVSDTDTSVNEDKKGTVNSDTQAPTFVGFLDRIVVNLNAVDVDFSKYYLAIDNDKQMQVTVTGDVNLAAEGEYPVTVSATDEAGNTTTQNAVVQVISEDTMVAIPLELTPMIDGSIPMAPDTKQRVDANVILYYYGEVSQEIQNEIARLGLDVSGYHLDTYWHPNDLNVAY
ncbi:hypothetical protein H5983_02810 [Faecalitalea cylindroides]|uniref:immunoglobulin-like domain-containing protein n=1 Tax=Faecalitalea cylindroides TaxID=39483 RepID=UPI00195AF567|nr:immunoglobulin-like domain-containing protein [Faecalitalea cylindroides]MBM6810011.1 hypothetical protein [Faecalitalea cylindroides]